MNEEKSIAAEAYKIIATDVAPNFDGLSVFRQADLENFMRTGIEIHERRKPSLQTEEHWMLLELQDKISPEDRVWQEGRLNKIPERYHGRALSSFEDRIRKDIVVLRLVRVPVDGGWVRHKENAHPSQSDANWEGSIEVLVADNKGVCRHRLLPFAEANACENVVYWRTPTPPPIESKPVDDYKCENEFCTYYHETIISWDDPRWRAWKAAWTAREKSLTTKEGAK